MSFTRKHKLELTWIGKEYRPKLEPRLLLEEPEKSYHAPHRVTDHDIFDNRLIFSDNLLALKALEQEFTGEIKCIYIDPPYNTGSAFAHYNDSIEHSIWLSLMRDRLELLCNLLADSGVIFVQIDDHESAYLKILMDEVFQRRNFLGTIIWQKRISPNPDSKFVSGTHDYILCYARNIDLCQFNRLPRTQRQDARYENPDNDPRGPWTSSDLTRREYREHDYYPIMLPSGREVWPARGRSWSVPRETFAELIADNRIWFGPRGDSMPRRKRFLSEVREGIVPTSWWSGEEAGKNEDSTREIKALFPDEPHVFATSKPERLVQRCLELGSNPGDWVLDSFAGSGTTGAVAHKMGRRWIIIELGEHCHTHIIPRLQKVIDGSDQGGISQAVSWQGGGGFRYFQLAPSLLEKDKWGNWVINKTYKPEMLTEAVCKLEGFVYAPSDTVYWQHGYSTEQDFIYVTTQNMRHDQLQQLSDDVGEHRSLLVMCTAFRAKAGRYSNLTIKKIPQAVLSRCEWGHDDYSLRVENLPQAPPKPGQLELALASEGDR